MGARVWDNTMHWCVTMRLDYGIDTCSGILASLGTCSDLTKMLIVSMDKQFPMDWEVMQLNTNESYLKCLCNFKSKYS